MSVPIIAENRSERHASAPTPSTLERYLGTLLEGMSNDEAGAMLKLHPAWVPTRRKGKRWTFAEVLRLSRHVGKSLGDLSREAAKQ